MKEFSLSEHWDSTQQAHSAQAILQKAVEQSKEYRSCAVLPGYQAVMSSCSNFTNMSEGQVPIIVKYLQSFPGWYTWKSGELTHW